MIEWTYIARFDESTGEKQYVGDIPPLTDPDEIDALCRELKEDEIVIQVWGTMGMPRLQLFFPFSLPEKRQEEITDKIRQAQLRAWQED